MDCKRIERMFSAYIDNELSPDEERIFKGHIASCRRCREALREYERSWEMLSLWQGVSPSPGYESRFWTKVTAQTAWQKELYGRLRDAVRPRRLAYVLTTMLLAFLLVNVGLYEYKELQVRSMLVNMSEEEWEMLENYEVIANLDLLNGSEGM